MNYTVTLTGTSSVLQANFFPIELGDRDCVIGLLSFDTYNTIPNVVKDENDMFYYGNDKSIRVPEGTYELTALDSFLGEYLALEGVKLEIRGNTNTLKTEIRCTEDIYFNFNKKPNSIGPLLGFRAPDTKIKKGSEYTSSDSIVEIFKVNVISVKCSVSAGSFLNGRADHTIHQFFPTSEAGYKVIEQPIPVIYLPVNTQTIYNITVRITDQEDKLINFRGETITIRLHLKQNGH